MNYPELDAFAAPARPRAEVWRTALGVVLIVAIYIGAIWVLFRVIEALAGPLGLVWIAIELSGSKSPGGLAALLYTFVTMVLAVAVTLWLVFRRGPATLFGPLRAARADFGRTALPMIALAVVLLPLSVMSESVGRHLTLGQWLFWLPLALPALLIQTAAEEMVFRGFLMQQIAARFRAPLAAIVVPSVLFGLVHHAPGTYGQNAWLVVAWTFVFGLLAADLTARTGNLGAAIGFHFANNFAAIFLVGLYGDLDALALWNTVVNARDPAQMAPLLLVDAAWMIVAWLLARVMLRV